MIVSEGLIVVKVLNCEPPSGSVWEMAWVHAQVISASRGSCDCTANTPQSPCGFSFGALPADLWSYPQIVHNFFHNHRRHPARHQPCRGGQYSSRAKPRRVPPTTPTTAARRHTARASPDGDVGG